MALTPIYARSPYFMTITGVVADDTRIDLYIWNDPATIPATPTTALDKPIVYGTTADYDISIYLREYIAHQSYTAVTADTVVAVGEYCKCTVKTYLNDVLVATAEYIVFDGYGYFEDGQNPVLGVAYSIPPMLTAGDYNVSDTGDSGTIGYFDDGTSTLSAVYTGLLTGGITTIALGETVGQVPYLHPTYAAEGNKLEMKRSTSLLSTYYFRIVCEGKYDVLNCDFVNRFGFWQRLVFFKANQKEMTMSNNEYKLMPETLNYNTSDNINHSFNTNGQENITCNTGWVDESYSEVIKELLFSEKVLVDGKPVKLSTKNAKLMTHLNDKLINYQLKFDYANQMINYII